MDYKIALCDDEEALLRLVSGLVGEWAAARQTVCGIETFPSAEAFLFQYQEDKSYDILLLDIEMTGMDGVELARPSGGRTRRCRSSSSPGTRTTSWRGLKWRPSTT